LSAIIYVPIVISRNAWPVMPWEAATGLTHATVSRILSNSVLALMSIAIMASCRDVTWREFGFQRASGKWLRFSAVAVMLGMVTTVVVKASGASGLDGALAGTSPLELLIVLLVATCVEELFVRGWIQGFLAPLQPNRVGIARFAVSVPVATGALVFGAMHLSLILREIDTTTVLCVLSFTTILGLLAGLARERTGSLVPAIGTHLAGNIGGILGGILYAIATGATPNH
jgi:membrane protease YdiL (CAAX protease family)